MAAASGEGVGIAWLTRAQENPRVQMVFSSNSGPSFSEPIRLDDGNPLGRIAVTLFDADRYVVAWIEKTAMASRVRCGAFRRTALAIAKLGKTTSVA